MQLVMLPGKCRKLPACYRALIWDTPSINVSHYRIQLFCIKQIHWIRELQQSSLWMWL